MIAPLRVVTLAGDADREADVAPRLSRAGLEVLMRCMDRIELLGALRGGGLDAVVAVGAPAWLDAQAAEETARAGVRLVGIVSHPPDADRLAAFGAALLPGDATVAEIVDRCTRGEVVVPPPPPNVRAAPPGRLVAVWGPKGSPGRSTIALELAFELARSEASTLLVDADTYGGDLLQMLGIVEEVPTILWAARLAARRELDSARLMLELRRAGTGPVLLPGLPRPQLWADISEYGWRSLLDVARDSFRATVCDLGFSLEGDEQPGTPAGLGRNRVTVETLRAADHVIAVCRADPTGIKTFLWAFEDLRQLVSADRVTVVANRVHPGEEREVGDLLKTHTGKRPAAYVPDRPADVRRALTAGEPVSGAVTGSDIRIAIRGVAAAVGGAVRPVGLLSRLGGRA
ncbi:MAG TPA: P-loop NTPase [Actinomycetota bacterium]|nr:P-loop NTPase [Actinomycetota bacterium]